MRFLTRVIGHDVDSNAREVLLMTQSTIGSDEHRKSGINRSPK